jgi:hypothetical protein
MRSIVIVGDHPVMRRALEAWFAGTGRRQVLGTASNLEEARLLLSSPETPVNPNRRYTLPVTHIPAKRPQFSFSLGMSM